MRVALALLLCLSSAAFAAPRLAILDEPGFPFYMASEADSPRLFQDLFRGIGLEAVEDAALIEHAKSLGNALNEAEEHKLIADTLAAFLERHRPKAERVCVGLPGRMALIRQFELPPVDPARWAEELRSLLTDDLVDELRLMIDPLVLGGGKRIFPEDGQLRRFRLAEHEFTNYGALLTTYSRQREEE